MAATGRPSTRNSARYSASLAARAPALACGRDWSSHEPSRDGRPAPERPAYVKHHRLVAWVAEMAALTEAADVYWCDGSQAEYERLCEQLVAPAR
jgi:hypothetical protein